MKNTMSRPRQVAMLSGRKIYLIEKQMKLGGSSFHMVSQGGSFNALDEGKAKRIYLYHKEKLFSMFILIKAN